MLDLPPLSFWSWYLVNLGFWTGVGLLLAYCFAAFFHILPWWV